MVFQVVRSIIFHFVVGGVLIFELYIVRSKFKYLYKVKVVHTDKIRRKVQRVRFLYCNSIIFVSYWIPLGIFNICYELTRKPSTRLLKEYPTAMYIVSILFFVYVMCLPLILLWASDLLRGRKKSGHAGIEMRMSNSDFSRHSTQGIVTCHIPNITITTERNEIIQRDTQAVMMQQVQVEVYV
ncbi:uncharacterized protein LOC118438240 [Folsomia candida]|nr:uncharacterized protein LOC118438240 [Folsomia candida]